MDEIITKGLLKEGSLSARIYFLLLNDPITQSELSRLIYGGKVQLDNIKKNLDDLENEGYVKKLDREFGAGKNYNQIKYTSTLKPLIDFIINSVTSRKNTSKSTKKEEITKEDIDFMNKFFNSKWFKRFYSQEYMNVDLECSGKINNRFCSCPIRFLARLIEEVFVITESFGHFKFLFNKQELDIEDFDKFIIENQLSISETDKKRIKRIVKWAKSYLGSYDGTNKTIDLYFYNYGILFLPYSLSKKLSSIGRVPLTVSIAFTDALKREFLY
ncbi:MAG: hypothetical protein WC533_04900 [Candidatus Pacearchaeota archaeon]